MLLRGFLFTCYLIAKFILFYTGIYIVRHRRLQRSFLSFANSHYDTRSGTTTFSAGDELGTLQD